MRRTTFLFVALGMGLAFAAALTAATSLAAPAAAPAAPTPAPWPMFHRDERHTGVITDAVGNVLPGGPLVLWKYRVTDELTSTADLAYYRWATTFPLGDLDGDGTLEIIVTTPDVISPVVATLNGQPVKDRIIALKDMPGQNPPYKVLWVYTSTLLAGQSNFDTYSPALADADGDGKLDVIFTAGDNMVRALKGTTGQLLWQYDTGRITEAGPMVADLDGNGSQQAIIVTACTNGTACPNALDRARLIVLPITGTGTITQPLWSLDYPFKMDSAEPAVADLDLTDGHNRKAIIAGTWGGNLLVAWRKDTGQVVSQTLDLHTLDAGVPVSDTPVIRSSPLVWDWGEGPTAVFAWLPTDLNVSDSRISAVGLTANMVSGIVTFTNRWTRSTPDVWKSSPTLLPDPSGVLTLTKIVAGYGLGIQQPAQSGPVGQCDPAYVTGGIVALNYSGGTVAWQHDFVHSEGNIRASAAVADINGDGVSDVILPVGCYGKLHVYNAAGAEEWILQLGPRAQNSPSVGDLDRDGKLDIVLGSYDGNVWVLSGGARTYLPAVVR
jgi:outer membrane protein assembly factor BamB